MKTLILISSALICGLSLCIPFPVSATAAAPHHLSGLMPAAASIFLATIALKTAKPGKKRKAKQKIRKKEK